MTSKEDTITRRCLSDAFYAISELVDDPVIVGEVHLEHFLWSFIEASEGEPLNSFEDIIEEMKVACVSVLTMNGLNYKTSSEDSLRNQ